MTTIFPWEAWTQAGSEEPVSLHLLLLLHPVPLCFCGMWTGNATYKWIL